jgi:cytochrome d ubiquinol oxidase subunit II
VSTIVALVLWFCVTCYAVFGGADYGAGFWDLTAGGKRHGARARALIDHAMAPIWEANNVWLIFALVVLWTAFPRAFGTVPRRSTCRWRSPPRGSCCEGAGSRFAKRRTI